MANPGHTDSADVPGKAAAPPDRATAGCSCHPLNELPKKPNGSFKNFPLA